MSDIQLSFASEDVQDLALPHQVQVDRASGSATIRVEFPTTLGRAGVKPKFVLSYSSAAMNSSFGMGWNLSGAPSISVSLDDGVPFYDGSEKYAFDGGELTPWLDEQNAEPRILDGGNHWIHFFRSQVGSNFARFERWVEKTTRQVHWRMRTPDNSVYIFGLEANGISRISDPEDARRTSNWLLEWQIDQHGNAITYEYVSENLDNVPKSHSFEQGRFSSPNSLSQRYLKRVRYGNTNPIFTEQERRSNNSWLFDIVLDYGEHDTDSPNFSTRGQWRARLDPFSTYRYGFEVRTYRLCRRILMYHNFPELGSESTLVGSLSLSHKESAAGTTLQQLVYTGHRRVDSTSGTQIHKSLPPLTFNYTDPELGNAFAAAVEQTRENAPQGLGSLNHRWIDLYGEGLPGILWATEDAWYYKPNLGGGQLGPQHKVVDMPAGQLGSYAFSDFDGDGNGNLVVIQGRQAGYYEYDSDLEKWNSFRPFSAAPHVKSFDHNTQLLDLSGDGRADIVAFEQDRVSWFRSDGKEGFEGPIALTKTHLGKMAAAPTIGANQDLDYFFADMTGDGRPDQVRVQNGRVEYWPQLGNGRFGSGIVMEAAPVLDYSDSFDASRLRLVDLDGTGTSDLLYIGRGIIRYWINASGNRFIEGGTLRSVPYIDDPRSVQILDFLGDGTLCLVWSTVLSSHAESPIQYLKLTDGVKPRLLVSAANSMGKETRVNYGHSSAHYLRDKRERRSWHSKLPRHVTVVDSLNIIDHVGGTYFQNLFEYHDGYFDSNKREFRGFGLVDQFDLERIRGRGATPEADSTNPVCARAWFHNGVSGWESKRAQQYYRGDPQANSLTGSFVENESELRVGEFSEAYRVLAGRAVRTELYGLDADGLREPTPYQVTQTNYRIRRVQPKLGRNKACFAAFPSEEPITTT